jgi:hypothetical protein
MNIKERLINKITKIYIGYLSREAKANVARILEVEKSINDIGYWEYKYEWRMLSNMNMRIEPYDDKGTTFYKVQVNRDDMEINCSAITIDRAVEFIGVFESLSMDLWFVLGWPSWKGKQIWR